MKSPPQEPTEWSPSLTKDGVTLDKMEFVYNEAKERLAFAIDCFDVLTRQRNQLIRFTLGLASAGLGLGLIKIGTSPLIAIPSMIFGGFLYLVIGIYSWFDFKARGISAMGRTPQNMINIELFDNPLNLILASQLTYLNGEINKMVEINKVRGRHQNLAVRAVCLSPLGFLLVYLLLLPCYT